MTIPCWACKTQPAGSDCAGPNSAYCAICQPRDTRPQPRRAQCGCASCSRIFATLTDFDRHQQTGRCSDPASIGLELSAGVWGTPAGNVNRDRLAAAMTRLRDSRSCDQTQTGEQRRSHISGTSGTLHAS